MRNAFSGVYLAVAVATFSHTTWAAAMVFQGDRPQGNAWYWLLQGALFAVAIDAGMMVTAHHLQRRDLSSAARMVLIFAFAMTAIASGFTQVLYTAHHSAQFTFGAGMSPEWRTRLQPLVDARVVLLPLALPVFAMVYALAGRWVDRAHDSVPEAPVTPSLTFYCPVVDRTYGPYKDRATLENVRRSHYGKLLKAGRIDEMPPLLLEAGIEEEIEV